MLGSDINMKLVLLYFNFSLKRYMCFKHAVECALEGDEIGTEIECESDINSDYNMRNYLCPMCHHHSDDVEDLEDEDLDEIREDNFKSGFMAV
jgi:Zn finger protein HypA/HybF involved in hydrogenase expression